MKRARYLELVASNTLASGLPLDEALSTALGHLGNASPAEARAVVEAREGRLQAALGGLGIDPLVSAAAVVSPDSAAEVSRRLRALPASQLMLAPLWNWTVYLVIVFAVIAGAAAVSSRTLSSLAAEVGVAFDLPLAPLAGAAVLVSLATFVLLQLSVATRFRAVRLATAAAALASTGGEGTLPAFVERTGTRQEALERLYAGSSARTLDELAKALLQRLESDVLRLAGLWRVVGSLVAAALAGAVAMRVYVVIGQLGGGLP